MSTSQDIDSLPKGGPVQTSYEEKLWLYSLYKQGTEGDISIPRPGMLDILGKAKWDSWNKQKGIDKAEAKRLYVNALLKILKKHSELENVKVHLSELESFGSTSIPRLPMADMADSARPASPASSTSSYHSSQASPPPTIPPPPTYNMLPPDPLLPPPDVAEDIVPPSALTSSHRSLLSLSQAHRSPDVGLGYDHASGVPSMGISAATGGGGAGHVASRAHSLIGGRGGSGSVQGEFRHSGKDSVHSFRQRPYFEPPQQQQQYFRGGPGFGAGPSAGAVGARPYSPQVPAVRDFGGVPGPGVLGLGTGPGSGLGNPHTPDPHLSPYLGLNAPTPIYPARPGSTSTFLSHAPPQPLNVANTLQSIQTSLVALHERLSVLERTQAMILRKDERRRNWFWTSREDEELDEIEDDTRTQRDRIKSGQSIGSINTITKVSKRKGRLSTRVLWFLLTAFRRALVDVGVGMMILLVGVIVLGGGWRRARFTFGRLKTRLQKYITE
ncbi:hypothetical protein I317_02580 [Kwoniella heveanensis CBS 569]|nr:hypothetical protein I317_02580 [Kwoniella heveanensis CBS 569]